jgi:hypothetical protein
MAIGYHMKKTSKHFAHDMKGGAGSTVQPVGNPVVRPKSIGTFNRSNRVDRSDALNDTGYGRNQYPGKSQSDNIAASHKLSDFDIAPTGGDEELDELAGGVKNMRELDDDYSQTRTVSDKPLPTTFGLKKV